MASVHTQRSQQLSSQLTQQLTSAVVLSDTAVVEQGPAATAATLAHSGHHLKDRTLFQRLFQR